LARGKSCPEISEESVVDGNSESNTLLFHATTMHVIPDVGCRSEVDVEEVFFYMTEKIRTFGSDYVSFINFDIFPEALSR